MKNFSIFPDDNAVIFAASLVTLYYTYSYLILSSIVMIRFYILSKRLLLKHKGLFDAIELPMIPKNTVLHCSFGKDS